MDKPSPLLMCPVCDGLYRDPKEVCDAGHVTCEQCCAGLSTCPVCSAPVADPTPNRYLRNQVASLPARCRNHPRCSVVVALRDLDAHVGQCQHDASNRRVVCPQGCRQRVAAGAVEAHVGRDCPLTEVPCPIAGCDDTPRRKELDKHLKASKHILLMQAEVRRLTALLAAGDASADADPSADASADASAYAGDITAAGAPNDAAAAGASAGAGAAAGAAAGATTDVNDVPAILTRLNKFRILKPDVLGALDAVLEAVDAVCKPLGLDWAWELQFLCGLILEILEVFWELPTPYMMPTPGGPKPFKDELEEQLRKFTDDRVVAGTEEHVARMWGTLDPEPTAFSALAPPPAPLPEVLPLSAESVANLRRINSSFLFQVRWRSCVSVCCCVAGCCVMVDG